MFKMPKVELDSISDISMHVIIEKGIRGGISYIAKRHSNGNNEYMKCYNSSKESKYIAYLDANTYGCEMSQYLSYSGFKLNSISENS